MKKMLVLLLGSFIGLFNSRAFASLPNSEHPATPGPTVEGLVELGLLKFDSTTGAYTVDIQQLKFYYGEQYVEVLRRLAGGNSSIHFTDLDNMELAGQEGHPEKQ
jgi:hypothetical protein